MMGDLGARELSAVIEVCRDDDLGVASPNELPAEPADALGFIEEDDVCALWQLRAIDRVKIEERRVREVRVERAHMRALPTTTFASELHDPWPRRAEKRELFLQLEDGEARRVFGAREPEGVTSQVEVFERALHRSSRSLVATVCFDLFHMGEQELGGVDARDDLVVCQREAS